MKKNNIKKQIQSEKGITLVVLVVTIIVMIILTGVGVGIAIGENGIVDSSQNLKDSYELTAAKADLKTKLLQFKIERNGNSTLDLTKYLTDNGVTSAEKQGNGTYKIVYEGYEFVVDAGLNIL